MTGRVQNKRVVVAGGGQRDGETIGNGRAIAVLFAKEGAEVFVVDRDLDRALATVAQITQEDGRAHAFAADISTSADCAGLIDQAAKVLGRIDVLVNNVGVVDGDSDGATLTEEAWDTIMSVNLKSMWLTSKACLPRMRKVGGGTIINISSVAGLNTGPYFAYGLSKSAVNTMTA